jgi:hypothetical protein
MRAAAQGQERLEDFGDHRVSGPRSPAWRPAPVVNITQNCAHNASKPWR